MILYYAIGGGLGHLTRTRAVIHTLGLGADVRVMTASALARDPRVLAPALPVAVRPELAGDRPSYNRWLRAVVERLAPEAIYIDAFPGGIVGELCDFPFPTSAPIFHVARLLRWEPYAARLAGKAPRFERVYRVEELAPPHERFLAEHASEVTTIDLVDPPSHLDPITADRLRAIAAGAPLWGILHSGPVDEVRALLGYADQLAAEESIEPQIILITQSPPPDLPPRIITLDLYPAEPLLPMLARIITGCGFNAMRQAAPFRERHRWLPFARPFDDQELRGARATRTA